MNQLRLVAGLFLAGAGGAWAASDGGLLAGERGLTSDALRQMVGNSGTISGPDARGYFLVQPKGAFTSSDLRDRLRSVDVVLDSGASSVDARQIDSVQSYISYLDGAFQIRTGRTPTRTDDTGANFYRSLAYYLSSRVDSDTGRLNSAKYRAAIRHRETMPPAHRGILDPGTSYSAMAPLAWSFVGPSKLEPPYQTGFGSSSLSGRKNAIAIAPSNPDTIYIASAGGGIWKSTDAGASFLPKSDGWPFMNTNCVAVHPTDPNTVYAGIGDYLGFFSGQTYGVMKSTDGGSNWTPSGTAEFGDSAVTRIMVDGSSPGILIALTAGPSGDVWRSTDAGQTWTRTNAPNGDWQDIDRTVDGDYLAVGAATGIYRSTDQGATWSVIPSPLLSGGTLWDIGASKVSAGRWFLMTSNHQLFRTIDLGVTWVDITLLHDLACADPTQNWSKAAEGMAVDCGVSGANDVVVTGLQTISVSDNGLTWTDVSDSMTASATWPAGQRDFDVSPAAGTQIYVAGVAGAGRFSYNLATNAATFSSYNDTIKDHLFYTVTVHPFNRLYVMGGAQDLATPATRGALYTDPWKDLFDTTGGGAGFDLSNPNVHYTTGRAGGVFRYSTATDSLPDDISPGGSLEVTPFAMGGAVGATPICGVSSGELRYYSGGSWHSMPTGGGPIRTIAISRHTTNRVYTGATNGDVYRAGTLGGAMTKIDTNLPDRSIGGIAESPYSPDTLLVGLQGTGFAGGVYRCGNATAATPTWTNVSGSGETALPAVSVNDVEFDPYTNVYYAATDVGVFVSPDAGLHWYNMNPLGLPNVPVNDLWVSSIGGQNWLYAATYGRGIWRCALSERYLTEVQIYKSAIYGGQQNTVTLKLNGAAPIGSIVALTDSSGSVSVPPSVMVPQGSTQHTFTIYTVDPPTDETVTINATLYKTTTTNSFTLYKVPPFTYTPTASDVYGGDRFNALIDLHMNAPLTTVFTFSDTAAEIASPASTSIALGGSTQTVALYTLPVATAVNATISARIANTMKSSNVTIHPKPVLATFGVSPGELRGGESATGTLSMEFAGMAGALTAYVSDTSTAVTVPPTVLVPSGSSSVQFQISSSPVTKSLAVTVKARIGAVSKTAVLIVKP